MNKNLFQQAVISAAIAVCDNAAFPDGNTQIPSELADQLGQALLDLAEYEEQEFKPYLSQEQRGLNSAQVSLQRLTMTDEQLKIE